MYAGHYAVGLALTGRFPRVRPWVFLFGVGLLDLFDGALVAAGVERVSRAPDLPLGFNLDFIDWDHSLLMAGVWAVAFGAVFWRDRITAALAAFAVFSHFLCDLPMHNGDQAAWPGSALHLGGYLWGRFPVGSWFIEGAFALPLLAYFALAARRRGLSVKRLAVILGFIAFLHLNFSPWLSPMKLLARSVEPPLVSVLHGALVFVGFAVPSSLLVWWLGRWLAPQRAEP